jgi:hypothetical protein
MKGCIRVITSRRVLLEGVQAGLVDPVDPVDPVDRTGLEDRARGHLIVLVVPMVPVDLVGMPSQLQ